jgi:ketosteroid isomerase-like protein
VGGRLSIGLVRGCETAERFFSALADGYLEGLRGVCAPGATTWINLRDGDRSLEDSLPVYAQLKSRVPDLRFEDVRRRDLIDGFVEQHTLCGTAPSGERLRVIGCFVGTVEGGRITRLEEYVDSAQAANLSAVLRAP